MKKQIFIFLILTGIIMSSCSKDEIETNNIIGQWKLIEQLADPGDGSGVFIPINSTKTLTFFNDGNITTNKTLCEPYDDEQITLGTFSLDESKIITNCNNSNIASISFELKEGFLILNFISNEGFSQKFKKIK